MNKGELVAAVAQKTGATKKDTELQLNATIETIVEALKKGDKIQLVGFGTFEVRDRKEREGRNPRNPGETIKIAPKKAAVFKSGKTLKEAVNQ